MNNYSTNKHYLSPNYVPERRSRQAQACQPLVNSLILLLLWMVGTWNEAIEGSTHPWEGGKGVKAKASGVKMAKES